MQYYTDDDDDDDDDEDDMMNTKTSAPSCEQPRNPGYQGTKGFKNSQTPSV